MLEIRKSRSVGADRLECVASYTLRLAHYAPDGPGSVAACGVIVPVVAVTPAVRPTLRPCPVCRDVTGL